MTSSAARRVGRTAIGFGLLFSTSLLLMAPAASATPTAVTSVRATALQRPAATASLGTITGRVLKNETPIVGAAVTLLGEPTKGTNVSLTATTDATGAYTFTGLTTGTDWNYSISARYKGALFSTAQVALNIGQTRRVNVPVFEPTTSAAQITLQVYQIWIDYPGRGIAVQQDMQLHNGGKTAYVGTHSVTLSGQPTPAAIALPLAPGAKNLQYLGRFGTCCSVNDATTWWHTRPISPGTSQGTMRYEAPSQTDLAFPIPFETSAVVVLVPKGVSVTIPGLKYTGTKSDTGTNYDVYQGGQMATGTVVNVQLGKAPRNWALWGWIAFGVLVVVGALVIWFVARRRAKRAAAAAAAAKSKGKNKNKSGEAKAPKPKPQEVAKPSKPTPAQSAATWNELADQLARLDLAYESGGLTDESTYKKLREALVAKLVATPPPEA